MISLGSPSSPPLLFACLSVICCFFCLPVCDLSWQLFLDEKELCIATEGEKEQVILGRPAVFKFTALQVLCLAALWALK